MRTRTLTASASASASALLIIAASLVEAKHAHQHLEGLHNKYRAHRALFDSSPELEEYGVEITSLAAPATELAKRTGQCQFPTYAGLVAVAPDQQNAGWAMSPDQPCLPGNYCPYACPPGQVSMQWDPSATSYSYPQSMNGGLYCDTNGDIQKPFPEKPYCQDGYGSVGAQNNATGAVAFCQTVLPGNEAMLIPTTVEDWVQLAVPDTTYWCGTAAHFYINPPGVGTDKACIWGSRDNPVGNWSPYVAGANVDTSGRTFVKLGWNPIYLEAETPFRNEMPSWGVEIVCSGSGCNGLPCAIDPSTNGVNEMVGSSSIGAGGAAFCVVTVPQGETANFVVFDHKGGSGYSSAVAATSSRPPSTAAQSWGNPSSSGPATASETSSSIPPQSSTSSSWPSAVASLPSTSLSTGQSRSTTSTSACVHTTSSVHPTLVPSYPVAPHIPVGNTSSTYMAGSVALTRASSLASTAPAQVTAIGAAVAMQTSFAFLIMNSVVICLAICLQL